METVREKMVAEEGFEDDSAEEDRDYRRLLGRSASKGSMHRALGSAVEGEASGGSPNVTMLGEREFRPTSLHAVASSSTPLSSVKASLDSFDTETGTQSPSSIPPGAPGYIEPGSTPDKSVHDKIRLFAQRSATGQPHNHKELFGSSGQVQSAQAAAGDGWKRRRPGDELDPRPPKPRQVEQLVRTSRAETGVARKRGVRDVKRGKSADGKNPATSGGAGTAELATPSGESDGKVERLVASPRPPTWMCRVVVTAVEARDVPRISGEVMTDCACQVSLNAPGALTVSNSTKLVRSSGNDKSVKWKGTKKKSSKVLYISILCS